MDLACLVLGATIGVLLRIGPDEIGIYVFDHLDGWVIFFGSVILANYLAGSYGVQYTYSRFNLAVTWLFSIVFALLVLSITSYAWFNMLLGRGVLAWTIGWYSVLSLFLKMVVYRHVFRNEFFQCRVAVLGTGQMAKSMRELVENSWVTPVHRVVAYLDTRDKKDNTSGSHGAEMIDGVAVLNCSRRDFSQVAKSLGVDLILVGLEEPIQASAVYRQLRRVRFEGVEVMTALSANEVYSGRTPLGLLSEEHMLQITLGSELPLSRRSKRLFDVAVAIIGGAISLPVGIVVAAVIKISAPRSPVFHIQERVGQFDKSFRMLKFRTMHDNAEDGTGAVWAEDDDPRITILGKILRKCRLDEIPQFVNVLRGSMSIVGPRPERPELVKKLEAEIPYYSERSNVLPGLTGWAQIKYPYGSSVGDAARKLEYDLFYIKHMSLSMDLQILLRTLRIIVFGKERRSGF